MARGNSQEEDDRNDDKSLGGHDPNKEEKFSLVRVRNPTENIAREMVLNFMTFILSIFARLLPFLQMAVTINVNTENDTDVHEPTDASTVMFLTAINESGRCHPDINNVVSDIGEIDEVTSNDEINEALACSTKSISVITTDAALHSPENMEHILHHTDNIDNVVHHSETSDTIENSSDSAGAVISSTEAMSDSHLADKIKTARLVKVEKPICSEMPGSPSENSNLSPKPENKSEEDMTSSLEPPADSSQKTDSSSSSEPRNTFTSEPRDPGGQDLRQDYVPQLLVSEFIRSPIGRSNSTSVVEGTNVARKHVVIFDRKIAIYEDRCLSL